MKSGWSPMVQPWPMAKAYSHEERTAVSCSQAFAGPTSRPRSNASPAACGIASRSEHSRHAVKALHLAVPARRAGRRNDVADLALGEQAGERLRVQLQAPSVISRRAVMPRSANHATARSTNAVTVARRPAARRRSGGCDRRPRRERIVTEPGDLLGVGARTVAGDGVTGAREPRIALDVPCAAGRPDTAIPSGRSHAAPTARRRAAVAAQDRMDGGVRDPALAGDQPRTPVAVADQSGVSARPSHRDADRGDRQAPVHRMGCVGAIYLPPVLAVGPRRGRRRAAAGHDAEADCVD
jgi:hypothetical protein